MTERLQIRFEFKALEDRLLLRISDKERDASCVEYRFWITRRFVHIFIKAIDKLIEDELAADMQVSPDAIDAMKKFQKESALSKADFSSSYGADALKCEAFGDQPLLATTLKIKKKSKGKYIISLLNNEKMGINLTVGIDLVHTLQKMFLDSAKGAAWNVPLFEAAEEKTAAVKPAGYIS